MGVAKRRPLSLGLDELSARARFLSVEQSSERHKGVLPLFMTGIVAPFALRDINRIKTISGRDLGFAVVSGLALAAYFGSFFRES